MPPYRGTHCALDACRFCAWSDEYRQYVDIGIDDRLWSLWLVGGLRFQLDTQYDRRPWAALLLRQSTEDRLLESDAACRRAGSADRGSRRVGAGVGGFRRNIQ